MKIEVEDVKYIYKINTKLYKTQEFRDFWVFYDLIIIVWYNFDVKVN